MKMSPLLNAGCQLGSTYSHFQWRSCKNDAPTFFIQFLHKKLFCRKFTYELDTYRHKFIFFRQFDYETYVNLLCRYNVTLRSIKRSKRQLYGCLISYVASKKMSVSMFNYVLCSNNSLKKYFHKKK